MRHILNALIYALAGIDDGVHLAIRRIGKRSILDDMVQAAAIIAGFKRPVRADLVVPPCNVLVLAIRFHIWRNRLPGAVVCVLDQRNAGSCVGKGSRGRVTGIVKVDAGGRRSRAGMHGRLLRPHQCRRLVDEPLPSGPRG